MKTSDSILKIAPALLKSQKSIGSALKDSKNPHFKSSFASLNSVIEAVKEHLNSNGISVLQPVGTMENGSAYVETVLLHESGEYISDRMPLVVARANDPQGTGSGITYARRYSLQSILLVDSDDDDGEGAMNRQKPPQNTPEPKKHPEPPKAPKEKITPNLTEDKAILLEKLSQHGFTPKDLMAALKAKGTLAEDAKTMDDELVSKILKHFDAAIEMLKEANKIEPLPN